MHAYDSSVTDGCDFSVFVKKMPPKSQVTFTVDEDFKLVELVKKHPFLFDLQHEFSKNQGVRDNVWKDISDEMERSADDCKKRWKNIKDTYNKNKRIMKRKLRLGLSPNYKPSKWMLSEALTFLDDYFYERQTISQVQSVNDEYCNYEEEEDGCIIVGVEDIHQAMNICETLMPSTSVNNYEITNEKSVTNSEKRKLCFEKWPNKIIKSNEEIVTSFNQDNEEKKKRVIPMNTNEKEDSYDIFFKSMALTVKKFSPNLKIRAKKEIFNIITELEIEHNNATL